MFITNPEAFAQWFNARYPGAYRKITGEDVRDLTICGLIHRYGHYSRIHDGETIRKILLYEQMRDSRLKKEHELKSTLVCKMCGKPLIQKLEGKPGRPKEYCPDCESIRRGDRQ